MLAKKSINSGECNVEIIADIFCNHLNKYNELKLDYFSISDLKTLENVNFIKTENVLISTAVFVGNVRLIDNVFYSI